MVYGDYDGPVKADKGKEGGACNRTSCQNSPAIWYNHGSHAWYCTSCRRDIQFDSFNLREWQENWLPKRGHPMFETREMITAREAEARRKKYTLGTTPTESEELNRVIADVARMVPGECLMLDSRDLVGAKSIYHNDVEFTPADRVLGNIIGSAYTHSLRRDVTNGNAIIERHEDTGVRRYSAPDDRIRMERLR